MNFALSLLIAFIMGQVLRLRYQRHHIQLLSRHLATMQLEKHMETLTTTYSRAIQEADPSRQEQIFATVTQTEQAVAAQAQRLAESFEHEAENSTLMGVLAYNLPFLTSLFPSMKRDFRKLLYIHAAGFRYVADNVPNWDAKTRAYHFSAELYLFQHSCHWFCRSRPVADARLMVRHKVDHKKVIDSVSPPTHKAYTQWLTNTKSPQ